MLVSSEDVAHVLLREAHHAAPDRIVYLAHTPQFYPFGPASWNPDPQAALIRPNRSAAIVAIGEHMAGYIRAAPRSRSCGDSSADLRDPPFPRFGSFDAATS